MEIKNSSLLAEKKPVLKRLLNALLERYAYASILSVDAKGKTYGISKSGVNLFVNNMLTEIGYLIRVYDRNGCAEYAFNEVSDELIPSILKEVEDKLVAWKSEDLEVSFPEDEEISFEKSSSCEVFPEDMGDDEIMDRLHTLREKILSQDASLLDARVSVGYHKIFLSRNKDLTQNVLWSEGMIAGMARREEEVHSYFRSAGGCYGLEVIDALEGLIPDMLENLHYLLIREPLPAGEYDCICTPDVTGLIVHEAFGHGVEMDMFVKDRALAKDYVGKYVASPLVTMHDGAATPGRSSATFFFDDEGTIAQDTIVIDKGILKGGICDAKAAMSLGVKPTGNGRRESYSHKAYTRMTNTYFEAGNDKLEDMIASIDYGFMIVGVGSGMEDPKNWGIQCLANMAREIKDGKFTGKVYGPVTMTGYVPDLLKSISMMSEEVELDGAGWCGKGYKEWAKVSMGGPYIKARIRLG